MLTDRTYQCCPAEKPDQTWSPEGTACYPAEVSLTKSCVCLQSQGKITHTWNNQRNIKTTQTLNTLFFIKQIKN